MRDDVTPTEAGAVTGQRPQRDATSHRDASELDVTAFNRLPADEARNLLRSCLSVPRWMEEVLTGRPYPSWTALRGAAERSCAHLTEDEVAAALLRHPRIGERAGPGHDGVHSEREQTGVDPGDAEVSALLATGNAAYEQRFGRVFLIRAQGRSSQDILDELNRRLTTDDATERDETRQQLGEIAVLRLNTSLR